MRVGRRSFPFGFRPIFRGELLVVGSIVICPNSDREKMFGCFLLGLPAASLDVFDDMILGGKIFCGKIFTWAVTKTMFFLLYMGDDVSWFVLICFEQICFLVIIVFFHNQLVHPHDELQEWHISTCRDMPRKKQLSFQDGQGSFWEDQIIYTNVCFFLRISSETSCIVWVWCQIWRPYWPCQNVLRWSMDIPDLFDIMLYATKFSRIFVTNFWHIVFRYVLSNVLGRFS